MEYEDFEGIAVNVAGESWKSWGQSLTSQGIGLDDLISQSQLHLLELLPRVDTSRSRWEQVAYIGKSLRWALQSWIKARLADHVARVKTPDPTPAPISHSKPDTDSLMDLDSAMAQLSPTARKLLLMRMEGKSISAIARATTMSRKVVEDTLSQGMGMLRRQML